MTSDKLLLPWKLSNGGRTYRIFDIHGKMHIVAFEFDLEHFDYAFFDNTPPPAKFKTMQAAMYMADQDLISRGYEFIDEERAEKLSLLL